MAELPQRGMQALQTSFHFTFFVVKRWIQTSKFFHFRTHKVEFEMFAKEFSRKREGILISLQFYLKLVAFQKKLKVVESERLMCGLMEFSCEIIPNSK